MIRVSVQQAWDYLSKHTYFEVARAALERLYDRLAAIFQKRIRFLYLFLFFLLINAASLWLGKYFFGIDPEELKALSLSLNELVSHLFLRRPLTIHQPTLTYDLAKANRSLNPVVSTPAVGCSIRSSFSENFLSR